MWSGGRDDDHAGRTTDTGHLSAIAVHIPDLGNGYNWWVGQQLGLGAWGDVDLVSLDQCGTHGALVDGFDHQWLGGRFRAKGAFDWFSRTYAAIDHGRNSVVGITLQPARVNPGALGY